MEKYITLTRTIDAPREQVWKACVDQKQVAQWWAPNGFTNPVCEVDAKVGGKLYIVMQAGKDMGPMSGMKAPMKGVFTEVVEDEKLVFTNIAIDEKGNHLLEGVTTVTFGDMKGATKLTVHTGAAGTAPGVEQMLGGMEQGWNEQLDKLVTFMKAMKSIDSK
jgi:uncharacterized protein YndB with AHSA1/START domain